MKTKNDIIETVRVSTGLRKQDAEKAVAAAFRAIAGSLQDGEDVQLRGFGVFCCADAAKRSIVMPGGERRIVPAHKAVRFRASRALKEQVK